MREIQGNHMIDTEQKLFRTPQDALIFAFNYSMQQQGRPLADRMASPAARTGKGLAGNDGAGQAGMVRRELAFLQEIELAVLIARFAPRSMPCACRNPCCSGFRPNQEWEDAIRVLEQAALEQLAGHLSHYRMRRRLVEKAVGLKVEIKTLAKECGVNEKTVSAHWRIIKTWMHGRKAQVVSGRPKRERSESADVAGDDGVEAFPAVDGIESAARKRADNLLSTLAFVGVET
jgi:hypothetical protein